MKLLLFLGVIIGVGAFAISKFLGDDSPLDFIPKNESVTEGPKNESVSLSPASSFLPGLTGPAASTAANPVALVSTAPEFWKQYRFRHRAAPDPSSFSSWSALGVVAFVDPVSREVTAKGPEIPLNEFIQWLERADVMAQSCAVYAWTVYIDQSVQKGFDLVAAIRAASSDGFEARLGDGAVTLDLSVDRVAASLVAIADGTVVEVVQNPFVRLVDATEARIEAIQELPVPESNVSNGVAQKSIRFRKVGLQLGIKPAFNAAGRVSLDVVQTNGVVGPSVAVDGNQIPVVESQTVSSRVDLQVGEAVVLGGVRTYRHRTARGLFRNTSEKTEGALYVVLATASDAPKAVAVSALPPPAIGDPWVHPVPGSAPLPSPSDWIDGELLPPLNWKETSPPPAQPGFFEWFRRRSGK